MRVFVTGASGHIGAVVLAELRDAGHQTVGLVRSDAGAAIVTGLGARALPGDLDDLELLARAAHDADGVIHLGFKHEWMRGGDFAGAVASDLRVVETFGETLAGTGKALLVSNGTMQLAMAGLDRVGTEADVVAGGPRVDAENATIALADRGVRTSALRLPPTVHSDLDHRGFVPTLIGLAREHGLAAYLGDGANRWPAAHTRDVARLYRLALEHAPAGSRLHAVAEQGVPFRAIAESIGRHLGVPARGVTAEQAPEYLGFLAGFAGLDGPAASDETRRLLDWHPTGPTLLDDLDAGHYFAPAPELTR